MQSQSKQKQKQKQNFLFDLQKPAHSHHLNLTSHSQSTSARRHSSTYSTSACKKMLKSICEGETGQNAQTIDRQTHRGDKEKEKDWDKSILQYISTNIQNSSTSAPDLTVRQLKYKQAIAFLQKKCSKQTEEITTLTQDLNTLTRIRQQQLKSLQAEMQKIRRCQHEKSESSKVAAGLKKKISQLQAVNLSLKSVNSQLDKKLIKSKQLLRKKQQALTQMMAKNDQSQTQQLIITKQKQQLASLRQNFIKLKQKQDNLEEQNMLLRAKVSQYKKQKQQIKARLMFVEQGNVRLERQCQELSENWEQAQNEAKKIQTQLNTIIEQQNTKILELAEALQKIQNFESQFKIPKSSPKNGSQSPQSSSYTLTQVYKNEISEILKATIADKGLRSKLQGKINTVLEQMEEGMNRVLVHVVANTV